MTLNDHVSTQEQPAEADHFEGSQVITQMLAAFYAGDLPALGNFLNDDIETYQSENLPYSGLYHGIDGFMAMASKLNDDYQVDNLGTRMLDVGDETIIYMDLRLTARSTGRATETSNVEWYTFRDGKVARINIYYKDSVAVSALLDR